MMGFTSPHICT